MKRIVLFILLLIPSLVNSQTKVLFATSNPPIPNRWAWTNNGLWIDSNILFTKYKTVGTDTSLLGLDGTGKGMSIKKSDIARWGGSSAFDGERPITASILTGETPGGSTVVDFLNAVFYPTQDPTANLTATYNGTTASSFVLERMAAGEDLNVTLNWTAGRQASTDEIESIVAGGVEQSFSQPDAGGSVNGTQAVSLVRNTNTTYTLTVTTDDDKTATDNVPFTWRTKRYWGFNSDTTLTNEEIQGLTQEFATVRTKSATTVTNSTSRHLIIAFDAALDPSNVSEIWIGGFNSTGAFSRSVISFTNASGYETNYVIYKQINPTSTSTSFEIK